VGRHQLHHAVIASPQPDPWLRSAIRSASPAGLRVAVALGRRAWRDSRLAGARARLTPGLPSGSAVYFPCAVLEVVQDIKPSAFFEGKLANIGLGAKRLDGVVVAPGEVLSFWKLVGRPSAAAGFEIGRSIRGGAAGADVGGGLCQLSGIAYEAGLRAGLMPVERHPHSRDLYAEEDRFTPLGLDATVVWPYKDLRLANPLPVPVQFRFTVLRMSVSASVHATVPLNQAALELERVDHDGWREVRVLRCTAGGAAELVSHDRYAAPVLGAA
jgi:vancomycin resistance protein VanW